MPSRPVSQLFTVSPGLPRCRHPACGLHFHEHLVEYQKGGARRKDDEENSGDEDYRTIATRLFPLRTLHGHLHIQHLDELFWRCVLGFGLFHGCMFGAEPKEKAYLAPFLVFLLILGLGEAVAHFGEGRAYWVFSEPRYWIFPLQPLVCLVLLLHGWRYYELRAPQKPFFTIGFGILALLAWIAPQQWLGAAPRLDGFDPAFFGASGWPYAVNVAVRFLRLVVVVPLLEEIFWRGFLLRYLIDEDFARVPFGTFSWFSFGAVTTGFCLEHSFPDYPAAILTGILYNWVAYRTKSLSSCVLVHAVTNLLLGFYVLHTGQVGFW